MNVKRGWALGLIGVAAMAVGAWAADADNDGMDDAYESFFGLNTSTNNAALDVDGDGLDNLAESLLWSDPFVADTDRDGFPDGADGNVVSRAVIPWGDPCFTHSNDVGYAWPEWMVAAFKDGGEWNTNAPAWHVDGSETNQAGLRLEVDRTWLTNDLAMKVQLAGSAGATLYLDLYDTNGLIVVTNVVDNLLADTGTGAVKVVSIPLESHIAAVGLWLRHGTGDVTVGESVLYVDRDGDGLDVDQEQQLGTSDVSTNSDSDAVSDAEEVRRGTDPADAQSVNTVIYVDAVNGNDQNDGIHAAKATVNAGLGVAISGDRVHVEAGDYLGEGGVLNLGGKTLRLVPSGQVRIR